MPRLRNKSFTGRAPQTAGAIQELPDFNAEFAALPGGDKTNAALQRWWDLIKQRIEFNQGDSNKRFFQLTKTVKGVTASVETLAEITSDVEDYLEARYTINVSAGPVVTGMTLYSGTGPDTEVSYVSFRADRFLVNTAAGNKQIFAASASAVKLGDLFTVDLSNRRVYVGAGTYNSSGTYWYVDDVSGGRMSLGNKFSFDGSNLSINGSGTFSGSISASSGDIGGWTIGSSTISKNNAVLDSAGQLILGTSNDIVYISATDATYRIWIGNVTAASASFRVTKSGIMTASNGIFSGTIVSTNGSIGGFTIQAGALVAGSGSTFIGLDSSGSLITIGNDAIGAGPNVSIGSSFFSVQGSNGNTAGALFATSSYGVIELRTSGTLSISGYANTGVFTAVSFSGSGANLTSINAANISTGTLTRPVSTSLFEITGTSTDIKDNNLRVLVAGSPILVLNKDLPGLVINGNKVVGPRGTRGAAGLAEVVTLLDAWGAWA